MPPAARQLCSPTREVPRSRRIRMPAKGQSTVSGANAASGSFPLGQRTEHAVSPALSRRLDRVRSRTGRVRLTERAGDVVLAEAHVGCCLAERLAQAVEGEAWSDRAGLRQITLDAVERRVQSVLGVGLAEPVQDQRLADLPILRLGGSAHLNLV